MSFSTLLQSWPAQRVAAQIDAATTADVARALRGETCSERELAALLSPRATPLLESVAGEPVDQNMINDRLFEPMGICHFISLS